MSGVRGYKTSTDFGQITGCMVNTGDSVMESSGGT